MLILEDHGGRNAWFRRQFPEAVMVETVKEAIEALENGEFGVVSLDHDLNGEQFIDSARADCGMEVVRWMVKHKPGVGEVVVHTANRKAAMLMEEALVGAGFVVRREPFGGQYDDRGA
ncbi:hypothetical protein LCGC14_2796560 [marine sediment metagenome]|uniref:Cyclic-phosphate processing Receiver domain-containing protein n=1 Tax=marine sediment metagenome TaxID=412755 RepID=A0A0F8ZB07_9ZZZZ